VGGVGGGGRGCRHRRRTPPQRRGKPKPHRPAAVGCKVPTPPLAAAKIQLPAMTPGCVQATSGHSTRCRRPPGAASRLLVRPAALSPALPPPSRCFGHAAACSRTDCLRRASPAAGPLASSGATAAAAASAAAPAGRLRPVLLVQVLSQLLLGAAVQAAGRAVEVGCAAGDTAAAGARRRRPAPLLCRATEAPAAAPRAGRPAALVRRASSQAAIHSAAAAAAAQQAAAGPFGGLNVHIRRPQHRKPPRVGQHAQRQGELVGKCLVGGGQGQDLQGSREPRIPAGSDCCCCCRIGGNAGSSYPPPPPVQNSKHPAARPPPGAAEQGPATPRSGPPRERPWP